MLKRITVAVLMVLVAFTVASALPPVTPTTGKILKIEGNKVQIAIDGTKPDWVKKNAPVKFKVGNGKIVEVSEAGVTPVTISVTTPKAGDMKVGDEVSFQKGTSMAGC
ncbi:MAG: hypothetical protein NTY02_19995 [Acidobacteria bacterium]|nr:hypothetical protein [Acidobacteriota bacterium]